MEAILVKKGLWPVVSGLETHPGEPEGRKKTRDFRMKQYQARAEIILHVSPQQLAHCSHEDPMIIWNTLIDIHSPCGCSTIISLHCRLHKLHLDKAESMPAYIACAREAARLLSAAGHNISDDDLLMAITSGLPPSYNPFLISIDTLPNSEYSLVCVIPRLINEYTQQSLTPTVHIQTPTPMQPADDTMAITTAPHTHCPISEITCFKCNQKGHYQYNCTSTNSTDTANVAKGDDASF
jgi:hypothetical protein